MAPMNRAGPKIPTGVARSITGGNGEQFQNHQQQHQLECHPSVQSLADKPITYAQNLRHKPTHHADQQPAHHRLEPGRLLGEPQEPLSHTQQELREGRRNHTAGHAEHGIHRKLRRMDQLILRNLEQGTVAKEHAQNHPRSRRGQHHRADHRCAEIAHDLRGKQHRGQRRIKCGCNRGSRSHRDQVLYLLGAKSEETSEHGTNARTNLNRRPFAPQRNSAGKRCRRAEKLAQHGAQRDAPFARVQRSLRLRHSAASRIGKIAIQQVADAQRAHDRKQQASPRSATHRVQPHPHSLRQQNECDDRQARQSPDHHRQNQKYLALTLAQFGHAI